MRIDAHPKIQSRQYAAEAPEPRGTDLRTLLGVIRRNAWLVVLACVVCAGAAYAISSRQDKQYTASASVLLRAPSPLPTPFIDPSNTPERDTATDFAIASQDVVKGRAARALERVGEPRAAAAVEDIELTIEDNSDVLIVEATAGSPAEAARVSNVFAKQYIEFRRSSDRASLLEAQQLVQKELALQRERLADDDLTSVQEQQARSQIASLRKRDSQLGTLAALQTGNTTLVEKANPPLKASAPKPTRDLLIGAFAGLLLGLALALGRDQLDRRVRRSEDVETLMDLPVFGRVRRSSALRQATRMPDDLPIVDAEAFRMLRANLRFAGPHGEPVKSVLITSAAIEDGKTTIAFYTAAVAAANGQRVLLIEADVRRPVLASKLGLPKGDGLSAVLAGAPGHYTDYCRQVPVAMQGDESLTLDVLLGGKQPRNAAELIDSQRMTDVLTDAKDQYDLVVIDTPPVPIVSDAIPLMGQVDAVLVVARVGSITTQEMGRLRDQLEKVDAPTLGVIANCVPVHEGGYYAHGYDGVARELIVS
jgi:capsular exopolysaccharide synthesis family protein